MQDMIRAANHKTNINGVPFGATYLMFWNSNIFFPSKNIFWILPWIFSRLWHSVQSSKKPNRSRRTGKRNRMQRELPRTTNVNVGMHRKNPQRTLTTWCVWKLIFHNSEFAVCVCFFQSITYSFFVLVWCPDTTNYRGSRGEIYGRCRRRRHGSR